MYWKPHCFESLRGELPNYGETGAQLHCVCWDAAGWAGLSSDHHRFHCWISPLPFAALVGFCLPRSMSGCWGDVPGQAVSCFLGLGSFPQPCFLKSAGVAPSVRAVSFTDVKPDGISNHWSPWLFLVFLSSQRANPESRMTCCFTVRHMLYEGKWTYKSFYIQGVLSCSGIWRSKHNNECPHVSPSLFLLRFAG